MNLKIALLLFVLMGMVACDSFKQAEVGTQGTANVVKPQNRLEEYQSLKTMIEQLSGIEGELTETNSGLSFTNDKEISKILGSQNVESALEILVKNMDNSQKTKTLFNGEPAPLGLLCYHAVNVFVNPQNTTANWAGNIQTLSSQSLKDAKQAWAGVYKNKTYTVR